MMDWQALTLFLLILARMSGFVLFNPLLGRRGLPAIFRSGLALTLAAAVYPGAALTAAVPTTTLELMLKLLLELAVGYLVGLVMEFFFYIPIQAGEAIDTQMGMTMAKTYDAGSQTSASVTATLLNLLMMLLFFAANGHITLIRILVTSGELLPFGAVSFGANAAEATLAIFAECAVLAVKLCMPILAAELLGQVGMGILMKVIPQINVFAINIELKVIIGLVLTYILISPFSEFLLDAEQNMLVKIQQTLLLLR